MELWFEMAGGIKSEYENIKRTDVFEFYVLFDLWRDKQKRDLELAKFKMKNMIP